MGTNLTSTARTNATHSQETIQVIARLPTASYQNTANTISAKKFAAVNNVASHPNLFSHYEN